MIMQCQKCSLAFDDEFRTTICPHGTFAANDGANNFAHDTTSYLGSVEGARETVHQYVQSEADHEWQDAIRGGKVLVPVNPIKFFEGVPPNPVPPSDCGHDCTYLECYCWYQKQVTKD